MFVFQEPIHEAIGFPAGDEPTLNKVARVTLEKLLASVLRVPDFVEHALGLL